MDHRGPIVNTTVVHHHSHMSRTDPQMKIRLPDNLKATVEESAKANNRSMNAEIISRLERSYATEQMGLRGDALDTTGLMAMALLISLSDGIDEEAKKIALDKARAIASSICNNLSITDNANIVSPKPHKGL